MPVLQDVDVFISYAAVDNRLPGPFADWVTRFEESLRKTMAAVMGGAEPHIYFDKRSIEANHRLDEILAACKRAKIFLAIASPSYFQREWTKKELEAFVSVSPDPRQIFVIELLPARGVVEFESLKHRHFMKMHRPPASTVSNNHVPYAPDDAAMFEKVMDLAASITAQLSEISARKGRLQEQVQLDDCAADIPKKTVLLAQVTDDLEEERASVRRYLEQFGYLVLPLADYPQGGPQFLSAFQDDLLAADLIIQLLGPRRGRAPSDVPGGYVHAQSKYALETNKPLMQWRRSDLELATVNDEEHKALLSGLNVRSSTLEEFKGIALSALRQTRGKDSSSEESGSADFMVFVNSEHIDRPTASQIFSALRYKYSVALPPTDVSGSIQSAYNELLKECNALLLLCGEQSTPWTIAQLMHARKVRRGMKPLRGAICYGPRASQVGFTVPALGEIDCHDGARWQIEAVLARMADWHREVEAEAN